MRVASRYFKGPELLVDYQVRPSPPWPDPLLVRCPLSHSSPPSTAVRLLSGPLELWLHACKHGEQVVWPLPSAVSPFTATACHWSHIDLQEGAIFPWT